MNLKDLLTKGYFPEEILPPFTSEDLEFVITTVIADIDNLDPITKHKKKKISQLATYSTPKIKAYRRNLAIPNPLHYIRLSDTIVRHWGNITTHCSKSSISLSRLKVKAGSNRALLKPSFDVATREKILRSTGYRYLLKIDVAKCYGSIYTHSIPWALHTKGVSKKKRDRVHLIGNELDEDCRKLQDGQTVGLPIGPDSSRIISEIILSCIDVEIENQLKYLTGIRVIDDYHLYFKSQGDLEIARSIIHKTLKEYELELNQSKEKLRDLPEAVDNEWFSIIRDFRFRNKWNYQRSDLITYFDMVLLNARKFPDDLVLTYAMSKLRFTVFSAKNWNILQSLMLNALIIEPKIIPYIAQNLISYQSNHYKINTTLVSEALEEFILFHSRLYNDFEVAWALWILKSLRINISEPIAKILSDSTNSVVILTTLDLHQAGFIPLGLNLTNWTTMLTADNLYSENWLVAYEAKMKGWLTTGFDYISKDPFFKILKDNNVSFYKENRKLDLSKVKVNSTSAYFEDSGVEDEIDEVDQDTVFKSITPVQSQAVPDLTFEDDDSLF